MEVTCQYGRSETAGFCLLLILNDLSAYKGIQFDEQLLLILYHFIETGNKKRHLDSESQFKYMYM